MESLITKQSMDEKHEEALRLDIERTELLEEEERYKVKKSRKDNGEKLRIELSIDHLVNANRANRKLFFAQLVKDINKRIAAIRIARGLL